MDKEQEFERDVRQALTRVDAPAGFADRVLTRARFRKHSSGTAKFTTPAWRLAYAAAALLAVTAGGLRMEHARAEQRRAAEAQQQFAKAMELTDHALDRVTMRLQQAQIGQFTGVLESGR